jgi:hypothetical protein
MDAGGELGTPTAAGLTLFIFIADLYKSAPLSPEVEVE